MSAPGSFLENIGATLQDAESRKRLGRRISRCIRILLGVLTVFYAGGLVLLPVMAAWIGERNITLAFLLYLPRVVALIPLPFLFILTLPFSWKLSVVQLLAGGIFFTYGMGYEWRGATVKRLTGPPESSCLTVMTWN
ncbi:MAG: hypothetical protein EOP87_16520, partial [Verrucomicrobiaceae bacterium]